MDKTKEELLIELNKLQQKLSLIESANTSNKKLLENEGHYRYLFDSNPQPMWIYDIETLSFLEINNAAVHHYGYSREEFLAMTIKDIRPEEDIEALLNSIEFTNNPYNKSGDWRHLKKDGAIIFVEIISHAITINNRKARHVMVIDITSQKKAIEERTEALMLYNAMVSQAGDAFFVHDFEGKFLEVNQQACDSLGYSKEELLKLSVTDIEIDFDLKSAKKVWTKIESGNKFTLYDHHKRKDGTIFPVELRFGCAEWKGQKLFLGLARNITDRIKEEEIIKKDKELLNNFFKQSLTGFFIMMIDEPVIWNDNIDKEKVLDYVFEHQHFVNINQTMLDQYMVSEADFLNKTPNDIFAHDLKQGRKEWEELFNNGHLHTITLEHRLDGSTMWIEGDYICLYDSLGRITGHFGNQQDITKKKLAEEELKKSKIELEAYFENDISAYYILNIDGYVLNCNNTFVKLFGLAKKPEPGILNIIDFYKNPEQRKILVNRLIKERKIENYAADFVTIDGREINAVLNAIGIFDENDKLIKVRGFIVDITKQIKAEAATRLNDTALKVISQGVIITDVNRRVISSNAAFAAITGYSESEIIGHTCKFLQGTKTNPLTANAINEALSHHSEFEGEILNYRKDGTPFWNELTISPIFNIDGLLTHFIGVTRDITERKQDEEQLRKLSRAVEQSPNSVILTDTQGNIEYANPKTLKITGYELTELIGQNPKIFSAGEKQKEEYKILWQKITSGNEWHGEFHNKKKNGELYWEQASISPILNKEGEITHYLAVKEDISERKQILEDMIIAKEHAEQSDRLKSAFLANMSHEIRTPMNGILGFTDLLKEPDLSNEKQQKFIDVIQKSGARLLNIINDIVDISKIEAGLMHVDNKASNIKEQIEFIYTFFKPEAEKKGLQFLVKNNFLEEDLLIETDSEKIYAIFTNLIKNAVKFTTKGLIIFGYEKKGEYLEFYVKDTGIGIPKEKHKAIFERFIQADISNNMAIQGAGLGLSITKAYVELLGGKIWVESDVENLAIGKPGGTKFYFTIPFNTIPGTKTNPQIDKLYGKSGELAGDLKILIAEDDETSSIYLSILVEEFSSEILIAKNGFEAVEIYKNNPDIDLILMDMQMPILNGYEATSQIRQLNKKVVIIAQTAFALSFDKQKVINAGCNDYISKPISMDVLSALVHKYFNK